MANNLERLLGAVCITAYACCASGSDDYDIATRYLTMPELVVAGTAYRNVVIRLDSFSLVSVDGVSATPVALTWSPFLKQTYRWSDANTYCTTSSINGQTGWRLPTQPELTALAQSGTRLNEGGVWTSTPAQPTYHYRISLNGTTGTADAYADYSYLYVLCVR